MGLTVPAKVAQRSCFGQYEGNWAIHDAAARAMIEHIKTIGVDNVVKAGIDHPQPLFANPTEVIIDLESIGLTPEAVYFAGPFEDDEDETPEDWAGNPAYILAEGIAVIPVIGAMTKRATSLGSAFDGSVTSGMRKALHMALADERVKAVMFHVDSPGGSVSGTPDLADDIFRARKQKPIYAFVEDAAFSAAYWVATQASVLGMSPNAQVGSIGVMAVLYDTSEMAKKEGVKVELFQSVPGKAVFVPGLKMSERQKNAIQADVDGFHQMFVAAVNRGRGKDMSSVADGSFHFAQAALEKGMVDSVASFQDFFTAAAGSLRNPFESATALSHTGMPMAETPTLEELQAELAAAKEAQAAAEQRADAMEAAFKSASGKSEDEPVTPDAVAKEIAGHQASIKALTKDIESLTAKVEAAQDETATAKAEAWVAEQRKLYEIPSAVAQRLTSMRKADPEAASEFAQSYGPRKLTPEAPRSASAATKVDDDQVNGLLAAVDQKRFKVKVTEEVKA